MASVPFGDTFLLVGGWNRATETVSSDIYIFDTETEKFTAMAGVALNRARRYAAAVMVDVQAFPEC